jgi:hypothetical protein
MKYEGEREGLVGGQEEKREGEGERERESSIPAFTASPAFTALFLARLSLREREWGGGFRVTERDREIER